MIINRRWAVRAVLGVAIVCCLAPFVWFGEPPTERKARAELSKALVETDRLDPRWRWEQIEEDRPAITDAENSFLVMHEMELPKWHAKLNPKISWEDVPPNRRIDEERLTLIREALDERERSAKLAASLVNFPRGRAVFHLAPGWLRQSAGHNLPGLGLDHHAPLRRWGGMLPRFYQNPQIQGRSITTDCLSTGPGRDHVHIPRLACNLLSLDSEKLLHDGRTHEATDRIHAIFHAEAALRDEPFLISQLVRFAVRRSAVQLTERLLAMGEVGDDDLRQMTKHFLAERGENLLLTGIRGERAGFHVLCDNLESGLLSLADFDQAWKGSLDESDLKLLHRTNIFKVHAFTLRVFNEVCTIAQLSLPDLLPEWNTWEKNMWKEIFKKAAEKDNCLIQEWNIWEDEMEEAAKKDHRLILSKWLFPTMQRLHVAFLRDQALLSCTVAALAVERFRLARKEWPKKLEDLCPEFLATVPIDPYDGKPLRLSHRNEGLVIYSVGKDGRDDGGENLNDANGTDVGLRLWNKDKRHLDPEQNDKEDKNRQDKPR